MRSTRYPPSTCRSGAWGPHLLGAVQGRPLVQLAVRARPDGWRERPDGALFSVLSISISAEENEVKSALREGPEGSQTSPPRYFLRHPHGPKCWVGALLRLQEPSGHQVPQKLAPKFLPWSRDPSHVTAQSRSPDDKQTYMSESSELDSSPCPSDFQRL